MFCGDDLPVPQLPVLAPSPSTESPWFPFNYSPTLLRIIPTMSSSPSLPWASSSLSSPQAATSTAVTESAAKLAAWQPALYLVVVLGAYVIRKPHPRHHTHGSPSPTTLISLLFTNSHRRHHRWHHPAHLERRLAQAAPATCENGSNDATRFDLLLSLGYVLFMSFGSRGGSLRF